MFVDQQKIIFDLNKGEFREHNPRNYSDDYQIGLLFLQRKAISILCSYMKICGFIMIDNDGTHHPIDIQESKVVIFESTYNTFSMEIKTKLQECIIFEKDSPILSTFMWEWQFLGSWDAFTENGPFIQLCSIISNNAELLDKLMSAQYHIILPSSYGELCNFVQNMTAIYNLTISNPDYTVDFKYIIDALTHGYHMNMTSFDIIHYCYLICKITIDQWRNQYA